MELFNNNNNNNSLNNIKNDLFGFEMPREKKTTLANECMLCRHVSVCKHCLDYSRILEIIQGARKVEGEVFEVSIKCRRRSEGSDGRK